MDPDEVGGFQFSHLILAFIITACFVFVLYWLWTWPCRQREEETMGCNQRLHRVLPAQTVKPLYALELEPGVVVLQSEDGEFFRILREYDCADRTGNGSKVPEHPSSTPDNRYIPSYTTAYYQTRPSAPVPCDAPGVNTPAAVGDPPPWTPIRTMTPSFHY